MRRLGAIVAVVMLVALTPPGPAQAARPALVITSVTVTATGGTWPYCEVTGTLTFTNRGQAPGFVGIFPFRSWADSVGAMATTKGSGTVEMVMPTVTDYSQPGIGQPEGWYWVAESGSGPVHHNLWTFESKTTTYDFKGACPAPGTVIASGMSPWP